MPTKEKCREIARTLWHTHPMSGPECIADALHAAFEAEIKALDGELAYASRECERTVYSDCERYTFEERVHRMACAMVPQVYEQGDADRLGLAAMNAVLSVDAALAKERAT